MLTRRHLGLGGALLLTLVAVALVDGGDDPAPAKKNLRGGPRREARSGERAARVEPGDSRIVEVGADELSRGEYAAVTDSLFPVRSWRPPPPPPPPPKPVAPKLPFSYLGKMLEGGRTVVFLALPQRVLMLRQGDLIDNTYRVEELTPQAMVLVYLPLNQKQSLNFGSAN